jgi:hypothetical protein
MKTDQGEVKKIFRKLGSCSRTYFYLLNYEFDNPRKAHERAADPLAGGLYRQGYQCGMLWGAALAAGTEAYNKCSNCDKAIGMAVKATQHIAGSFLTKANSIECEDITDCDWTSKLSMAKYMITGKFLGCFNLAEDWAPDAVNAAREGLELDQSDLPEKPISCASEVVKKMGGTEEEMVMVAGFAGGLGLSGNACGALAAAVWKRSLDNFSPDETYTLKDPISQETLEAFYEVSQYEMLCEKITGKKFESVCDHTNFIKEGGCKKLIETLGELPKSK